MTVGPTTIHPYLDWSCTCHGFDECDALVDAEVRVFIDEPQWTTQTPVRGNTSFLSFECGNGKNVEMRRAALFAAQHLRCRQISTMPMHKGTKYENLPATWTVLGGAGNLGRVLVDFLIDAGASSVKVQADLGISQLARSAG